MSFLETPHKIVEVLMEEAGFSEATRNYFRQRFGEAMRFHNEDLAGDLLGEWGIERPERIPLTQGRCALVSGEDYAWLSQWKWHYTKRGYAASWLESGTRVYMHRLVLGITDVSPEVEGDHQNGNRLDNRRENLRLATRSQNAANTNKRANNTSGYKGVTRDRSGSWFAQIRVNGINRHLGTFMDIEDAARAYDAAAREAFGEFARTNFTDEFDPNSLTSRSVGGGKRRWLTPEQVRRIRRQRGEGATYTSLAAEYSCSPGSIHDIVNGQSYKEVEGAVELAHDLQEEWAPEGEDPIKIPKEDA